MADGTVDVVVLDVNETLTDMSPLADVFADLGAPRHLAAQWFSAVLAYGFTLTMAGTPKRFADIGAAVLPSLLHGLDVPSNAESRILGAFATLELHPDVPGGLRALRATGIRATTLTNGAAANTAALLERSGVADLVELTLSVDDAGAWKTDPRAYRWAIEQCAVAPQRALMVAVHPWDLHGAKQVGMRTAWLNRNGAPYPSVVEPPDFTATGLDDLASQLA